ncbi:MAG TPA: hypothetical protein G4O13_01075 [Dehalococcoidia bacterium]|nr:hypothetical protein [Dehalococcoidia bacterium]
MDARSSKHPSGQDKGSRYCPKHRRYYGADASCPICKYKESAFKKRGINAPRVQKCPVCGEMSLFWYQCSNRFECLNIDCKLKQSEAAY